MQKKLNEVDRFFNHDKVVLRLQLNCVSLYVRIYAYNVCQKKIYLYNPWTSTFYGHLKIKHISSINEI